MPRVDYNRLPQRGSRFALWSEANGLVLTARFGRCGSAGSKQNLQLSPREQLHVLRVSDGAQAGLLKSEAIESLSAQSDRGAAQAPKAMNIKVA